MVLRGRVQGTNLDWLHVIIGLQSLQIPGPTRVGRTERGDSLAASGEESTDAE
jgi:hypothetical protein